jgi:hypothetical protein
LVSKGKGRPVKKAPFSPHFMPWEKRHFREKNREKQAKANF